MIGKNKSFGFEDTVLSGSTSNAKLCTMFHIVLTEWKLCENHGSLRSKEIQRNKSLISAVKIQGSVN